MVIWNYNQNDDVDGNMNLWLRGLKDVVITYSTGNDTTGLGHSLYSGQLQCATGAWGQPYTDDLILSTPASNVKAVKIVYSSNWGTEAYYGLSEVRFAAATPAPPSLALLASGIIGLLAYAWRKRR
jgi:hypothetical protein